MKYYRVLLLLAIPLLGSCADMDYDISEGFNKEITLFEDEVSVPIGNIGPLTIGSTLSGLSKIEGLGGLLADYIKESPDGTLLLEDSGDIFKTNIYELEKNLDDASTAQTWEAGYQSGYVGGLASLLIEMLGLNAVNQKVVISASNPLRVDVPIRCNASIWCSGDDDFVTFPLPELDEFTLARRSEQVELCTEILAPDFTMPVYSITFESLDLDLPANPASRIADKEGNLFFSFTYHHSCGISVGEEFAISMPDQTIGSARLPIGKYKLTKCELSVELENTIPIAVSVDNIRALKHKDSPDDPDVVDENIKVTSGFTMAGGSLEHPAVTPVTLTIEALEGTVPDIEGIMLDLNFAAQEGLGDVALSTKQGIVIKSSSAKVSGGITIPAE